MQNSSTFEGGAKMVPQVLPELHTMKRLQGWSRFWFHFLSQCSLHIQSLPWH